MSAGAIRGAGAGALGFLAALSAAAAPVVANPSFEADAYGNYPGVAQANGGVITGWSFEGNVGVNPWWGNPERRQESRHSFSDNGIFPDGRQVVLMQNRGILRQRVDGFVAGQRYRVTYYENARAFNVSDKAPRLRVSLGGVEVVSEHAVEAVDGQDCRTLPFDYVESAVFTAPHDGAFDLVFETLEGDRVTVLIDNVAIAEMEPDMP